MSLNKTYNKNEKSYTVRESFLNSIAYKGMFSPLGVVTFMFSTVKFIYSIQIIEGDFVDAFLMLRVTCLETKRTTSDMMTNEFINKSDVIKLFKELKNEIQ